MVNITKFPATYRLYRTGQRPLTIIGERIAKATTRIMKGKEHNRWHDLELYQTQSGEFFLHLIYQSLWEGELNFSQVFGPGDIFEMEQELRLHDPSMYVKGYPPGDRYREKQIALEEDLRHRFRIAVSEILEDFPEEAR